MERIEPRRFDRFLGTHPEDGKIEEDLKSLLVLAIAARTAERDVRLPIEQDNSWTRRRPWTLAAQKDVGVSVVAQDEGLHAVPHWDPGVASDEDTPEDPG